MDRKANHPLIEVLDHTFRGTQLHNTKTHLNKIDKNTDKAVSDHVTIYNE